MTKRKQEDAELNERENEVYDRQIRLWGVEAQKRMTSSAILFCGFRCVAWYPSSFSVSPSFFAPSHPSLASGPSRLHS